MYKLILLLLLGTFSASVVAQKINRKAVVQRHTVSVSAFDTLSSLSVGNGHFAFTVDATGLQSFPEYYANGVPLGTQSDWGWHAFPNTQNYRFEETLKDYDFDNRKVSYGVQRNDDPRAKEAANYFRANPHRLQLGNLGFEFRKTSGEVIKMSDIQGIKQKLNLWKGEIQSEFLVEGKHVLVLTFCHPTENKIMVRVKSALLKSGQIKIRLRLPYPTGQFIDEGINYHNSDKHSSKIIETNPTQTCIGHQLDETRYYIDFQANTPFSTNETTNHEFLINPAKEGDVFEFSCRFASKKSNKTFDFENDLRQNQQAWASFWNSGAAIDFSGTKDPRAFEIERRVVLSQYLTRIQCVNNQAPQETGLTYNSWFGKPHLEMHWWHGVHFAQWGRPELLQKSVDWYFTLQKKATELAQRQGYEGLRWQKMTDTLGNEGPSSVGAFLIWQQPHFIYFAELLYQNNPKIAEKYSDLVFKTADFMADYAVYEAKNDRYVLGKGLIPAQECFKPEQTFNPTFELAYWHWGLATAQKWRERKGLKSNPEWDEVLQKLSKLPQKEGIYLATESTPDSYTNPAVMIDHPAVLGAFGVLPPSPNLDPQVMQKTLDLILKKWNWGHTWGWDFPMAAMTATRLHQPEKAIDALLMKVTTNTYLPNGHNFQDKRLRIYLPGNGGVLSAVALMCTEKNGGFPKGWKVKWEGFKNSP